MALPFGHFLHVVAQHIRIDVGQGHEIGHAESLAGDGPALVAQANGGENGSFVGRLGPEHAGTRKRQGAGSASSGDALQKMAARGLTSTGHGEIRDW